MSRGRAVRFPGPAAMLAPAPGVPAIGPVVFALRFRGTERVVDLSGLPCPKLVRPLAAVLARIGGGDGTMRTWQPDFQQSARHLRAFAVFAAGWAADAGIPAGELGLAQVTPGLLEAFEASLTGRYGPGAGQTGAFLRTVVRLLRLAGEDHPGAFSAGTQARISYTMQAPRPVSRPLDAYPVPVLEAIQSAALADVRGIRDRIRGGRQLAATGSGLTAAYRTEDLLAWVTQRGPLLPAGPHAEHLRHRPGGAAGVNAHLFLTPADVIPFVVALICLTGLEPESAKTLRASCLSSPSRGFVTLSYEKLRARNHTAKSMRVRDGAGITTPGGLIRLALDLTGAARELAGTDALWAGVRVKPATKALGFFDSQCPVSHHAQAWARSHQLQQLTDRGGKPVRLDLRRLRKSVKSRQYLRSGGILDDFVSGHTKKVAAARYAGISAHDEIHEQAVEAGLRQALEAAIPPPAVVPPGMTGGGLIPVPRRAPGPDGQQEIPELTPAQLKAGTSPEADVFLAACTGFHASPFARRPGDPCPAAVWGCLECPNAVFAQRHLPSLLSFAAFMERERERMHAAEWQARYGLACERLNTGVLPAFTAGQAGKARAETGERDALPAQFLEAIS